MKLNLAFFVDFKIIVSPLIFYYSFDVAIIYHYFMIAESIFVLFDNDPICNSNDDLNQNEIIIEITNAHIVHKHTKFFRT